jgi:hypothetical protein
MLVNGDHDHDHAVKVSFANAESKQNTSPGLGAQTTFGQAQFQWHPGTDMGRADPDGPPLKSTVTVAPTRCTSCPRHRLPCLAEISAMADGEARNIPRG